MEQLFLDRMKEDLQDEFCSFLESLEKPFFKGLRYDPNKIDGPQIEKHVPVLGHTPFCPQGYYIDQALGNHPYHLAGLFYLQEPSATSAVEILDVQEDDIVLDLCAAPGGKSTQIASHLRSGFLVCNEYDAKRAQVLLSNLERMGVQNFVLTQGPVHELCQEFHDCFDKVLVDAPCSGEGMMKKHDAANQNWSLDNIHLCAKRQQDILDQAYKALKKDGILVYSTCTYAKEENEETIAAFLKSHPDMIQIDPGVSFGRKGYQSEGMDPDKVVRIYPMDGGEGHFVCKLKKMEGTSRKLPWMKKTGLDRSIKEALEEHVDPLPAYLYQEQEKIYGMEHPFLKCSKKIHVLRQGIYMGKWIKKRFEPEHALYQAYPKERYRLSQELTLEEMDDVMHGGVILAKVKKGHVAYCIDGYPFGFGKSDGTRINNKIPKGLRLLEKSHVDKGETQW